ncbi:hypothetical protein [uncultured Chryseobacterium sp.]|uniref:hypothetical protein n=1 Tax=uncultured Chryseobacterium sp. TaxID=259322 RepID=UPI0025D35464|nr:hypothetical protein [uncultured Chryseobacterium sp.]
MNKILVYQKIAALLLLLVFSSVFSQVNYFMNRIPSVEKPGMAHKERSSGDPDRQAGIIDQIP